MVITKQHLNSLGVACEPVLRWLQLYAPSDVQITIDPVNGVTLRENICNINIAPPNVVNLTLKKDNI